ncbi:MAG: hypothetical protein EBQ95_03890 [Gammaproteobacteria bacterium]|nr:hypothetical protein [Gammaproteobacteria bacterium]
MKRSFQPGRIDFEQAIEDMKDNVGSSAQFNHFIHRFVSEYAEHPKNLIFNQLLQILVNQNDTQLLCRLLELMELHQWADVQSFNIVLKHLAEFQSPDLPLIESIFHRANERPLLCDASTYIYMLKALKKSAFSTTSLIILVFNLSVSKNICTEQVCLATLQALSKQIQLSRSDVMFVLLTAMAQQCFSEHLYEQASSIFVEKLLGSARDLTHEWISLLDRHPMNAYESQVFMTVFDCAETLSFDVIYRFHQKSQGFFSPHSVYLTHLLDLLYQHSLELNWSFEMLFVDRIIDISGTHYNIDITGLNASETYYAMKRFFKKHMFLKSTEPNQFEFTMALHQQHAFLKACEENPKLKGGPRRLSDTRIYIQLDPTNTQLILSQYSAFQPYRPKSTNAKPSFSIF